MLPEVLDSNWNQDVAGEFPASESPVKWGL